MRTIEYAVAANGSMPAKKFIEEDLDVGDRAKLLALLKRRADTGDNPNPKQFKQVRGKIFEFKKDQVRVFCFRDGRSWILTNGYKKKQNRLAKREIDRAERIMAEHLAREGNNSGETGNGRNADRKAD